MTVNDTLRAAKEYLADISADDVFLIVSICLLIIGFYFLAKQFHARRQRREQSQIERLQQAIVLALQPHFELTRQKLEESESKIDAFIPLFREGHTDLVGSLRSIRESVSTLTSRLDEMPELVGGELTRREREKIQAEAEDARKKRHKRLLQSLNQVVQTHQDLFEISNLTDKTVQHLSKISRNRNILEQNFSRYLGVSSGLRQLETRLNNPEAESGSEHDNLAQMEQELELLGRSIQALAQEHRAVWFINLLEAALQYPNLNGERERLKDLLGVEEIKVVCGGEIRELQDFDVVATEGSGRRKIIEEVIENGYRQSETKEVIRRPKVKVRLEA